MRELAFFSINLDRSKDRWHSIESSFGNMAWPLHRVPAFDADLNREKVLAARGLKMIAPPYGVGWNPLRHRLHSLVEEACFASHLLALNEFLESGYERAVILEDDAVPTAELVPVLRRIVEERFAFDIVKLEGIAGFTGSKGRLAIPIAEFNDVQLVFSFRPSSGAAAYLVTRAAAKQLIERAGKKLVPFDDYIWNPSLHGCVVMHAAPWLVWQGLEGSTMRGGRSHIRKSKRRDPFHFVSQRIARGSLRLQLWQHALKGARGNLFKIRHVRWISAADRQNARQKSPD